MNRILLLVAVVALWALPSVCTAQDAAAQHCVQKVASHFGVPPLILEIVLELEQGQSGVETRHSNGAVDLGASQISVQHLPKLRNLGISRSAVVHSPCVNVAVAAWHLRNDFDQCPKRLSRQACWADALLDYHSRTPVYRSKYRQRAFQVLQERIHGKRR